jgi:S-adenosylmethionine:tRNA ribosyltransferase-isomerase
MATPFNFTLPDELSAKEPPERRGLGRDKVRLLVIDRRSGAVEHTKFEQLAKFLRKGDLLVFNSSRTLPASLEACCTAHGPCVQVRLAQHLPNDSWLALLVCKAGDPFGCGLRAGMHLDFTNNLVGEVFDRDARIPRLWKIRFSKTGTELIDLIYRIGQPDALSPGNCSSSCAGAESILPILFCTPASPPTWTMSWIGPIRHRRRNIS